MTLRFCNARSSAAALLFLAACTGPDALQNPFGGINAPVPAGAEVDACATPQECAALLKKLVADPKRDWIGQPQSADAYANGTRLFAYRVLRKKLTCNELKRALEDIKAATSSMQEARYQRARVLVTDVGREISAEQSRRCRGNS